MATATAPTETEIRRVIEAALGKGGIDHQDLVAAFRDASGALDDLYEVADLRSSERQAIDAEVAYVRAVVRNEAIGKLMDGLLEVGKKIAREHPGIPRARQVDAA